MSKDPREEPATDAKADPNAEPPRKTLVPAFDVATYAKAIDGSQPRAPQVTITNEFELEEARKASMESSLPPARARARSEAELELGTADVVIEDLSPLMPLTPGIGFAPLPPLPPLDPELVLGDLRGTPKLLVSAEAVPGLGLDHHAGFMLALVDSVLSYDTILDVCGMPRKDALAVLARLVERKIIGP
jgi:hypothetical protein